MTEMKENLEIIKLINRLLNIPGGEQLYVKEIKMLFSILNEWSKPIITGRPATQKED